MYFKVLWGTSTYLEVRLGNLRYLFFCCWQFLKLKIMSWTAADKTINWGFHQDCFWSLVWTRTGQGNPIITQFWFWLLAWVELNQDKRCIDRSIKQQGWCTTKCSKLLFEGCHWQNWSLLHQQLWIKMSVCEKKLGIHQNKSDCNLMRCAVLGECRMIVATVKPSFSVHTPRWLFAPKYGLFCVVTTKISDCYLLDWRCPPWSACLRSHLRQTREVRRRWWWWSSPARSSSSSSSSLSSSRLYFFSFLLFHFPRNMSQAAHRPSKTREREMSTACCDKSSVTLETNPLLLPWQIWSRGGAATGGHVASPMVGSQLVARARLLSSERKTQAPNPQVADQPHSECKGGFADKW